MNAGSRNELRASRTSLEVAGGTFYRTYANSGSGPTAEADSATVSTFRLDEYDVTVGRFRQFVAAWDEGSGLDGGAGYEPAAGSGKHVHLNGGLGLVNVADDAGLQYETGWLPSDDSKIALTSSNLMSTPPFCTWTPSAGTQENLPINCVNWWEAYAFCIWDGGFLPSEAEYEYAAAGGSQQREYPWGSTAPGSSNQYAIYGCYYPNDTGCASVASVAPVGTATLGVGRWGQLDLAGNMNQWNLDWYAHYRDPCADCAYLTASSTRVFRGGYFLDYPPLSLVPSYRNEDTPALRDYNVGFRCARTP
jgi:sulfatase modifying factor 1